MTPPADPAAHPAPSRDGRTLALLGALVLGLFAFRIGTLAALDLPIYFDEAYYYWWSQHLDFGYYSKPPMVAWLIRLSCEIFDSHDPLVLRLPAAVLYSLTGIMLALVTRKIAGTRAATYALVLYLTAPVVSFYSWFITTDAPLMLCWAATLYAFLEARRSGRVRWWVAMGLAAGAGLMSKYALLYFLLGLVLYLLTSNSDRRLLTTRGFWLMLAIAALVFSPNVWWNLTHDLASVKHTAELAHADRASVNVDEFLDFFFGQFLVFGPVNFVLLGIALMARATWRDPERRLLAWLALPPILLMCAQALASRAHLNWAATAYLSGSVLVAIWLAEGHRARLLAASVAVNLTLALVFYFYHPLANLAGVRLHEKNDPYHELWGWPEIGTQVDALLAAHPETELASDARKILAYLIFYTTPQRLGAVAYDRNGVVDHHFEISSAMENHPGDAYVYVSESAPPRALTARFREVTELTAPVAEIRGGETVALGAWLLNGRVDAR